jgi:hypothetical protein
MGSKKALPGALLAVVAIVAVVIVRSNRRDAPGPDEAAARVAAGAELDQASTAEEGLASVELTEPFAAAREVSGEASIEPAEGGMLVGRVLGTQGTLPAGLRIWARPTGMSARISRQAPRGMVTLAADGTFKLGPLAAGEATVYLFTPAGARSRFFASGGTPHGAIELGVVEIPAGATVEREFFVLDIPGTIRVTVASFGFPVSGALVLFESHGGERQTTRLDREGMTAFPLLFFPGPWSVYVFDPENGWAYRHPEFAYVVAGQELSLDVTVQIIEGTITVIDRSKAEPLTSRTIAIRPVTTPSWRGPRLMNIERETDGAGQLKLALIPGDYMLEEGSRSAVLTWTAAGPAVAEIDL